MDKIRNDPDWQLYVLQEFIHQARMDGKRYTDELRNSEGDSLGNYRDLWEFMKDAWLAQKKSWNNFSLDRLEKLTSTLFEDQKVNLEKLLTRAPKTKYEEDDFD